MFIKYSQKYSLFIYFFNSTEVRTEALKIFCVMIPLLVDTWPDFALFRVVRPYCSTQMRMRTCGTILHVERKISDTGCGEVVCLFCIGS